MSGKRSAAGTPQAPTRDKRARAGPSLLHAPAPLAPLVRGDLFLPILRFCDKPTLATCMRTSKYFLSSITPVLYRHVTFDDSTNPFVPTPDPARTRTSRSKAPVGHTRPESFDHIRTLTVGSHQQCAESWSVMLSGLRVLQIDARPDADWELCYHSPCLLLEDAQYDTLIVNGLSSPCAEIPGGLEIHTTLCDNYDGFSGPKPRRAIFRFETVPDVYRASEEYRAYQMIPSRVEEMVFQYLPSAPGEAPFAGGAGRLLLDEFDEEEQDDNFGQEMDLPALARLFAEAIAEQPDRQYTLLDTHRWDPGFCGITTSGSESSDQAAVREAVEDAVRTAVSHRLRKRGMSPLDFHSLRFISVSDFVARKPDIASFLL